MNESLMPNIFRGRRILITGGTGFMGRLLCERLKEYHADVRSFSRRWSDAEALEQSTGVVTYHGSLETYDSIAAVVREFSPEIVIHSAAYKSVPSGERNPNEVIRTNILGTMNLIAALQRYAPAMATAIAISSDKAVAPINLYGKSKAVMESMWNSAGIEYACVRYGNVAGSTGSVMPIFHQLIGQNKPICATAPWMTRFNITPIAAQWLVLDVAAIKLSGNLEQLFVPKLPAFKISDLLTAFRVKYGAEIGKPIGIRPGEKEHEWLISWDEMAFPVENVLDIFYVKRKGERVDGEAADRRWFTSETARRIKHEELLEII